MNSKKKTPFLSCMWKTLKKRLYLATNNLLSDHNIRICREKIKFAYNVDEYLQATDFYVVVYILFSGNATHSYICCKLPLFRDPCGNENGKKELPLL